MNIWILEFSVLIDWLCVADNAPGYQLYGWLIRGCCQSSAGPATDTSQWRHRGSVYVNGHRHDALINARGVATGGISI